MEREGGSMRERERERGERSQEKEHMKGKKELVGELI